MLIFSYLLKLDSCQPAVDCSTGQGLPVHCLVSLLIELYLQLQREECIQSGALLPCTKWVVITSEGSCVVLLTSGRIISNCQLWWLMILLEVNGWSSTVLIPEECGLFNGDFRASCVACRCGTVPRPMVCWVVHNSLLQHMALCICGYHLLYPPCSLAKETRSW